MTHALSNMHHSSDAKGRARSWPCARIELFPLTAAAIVGLAIGCTSTKAGSPAKDPTTDTAATPVDDPPPPVDTAQPRPTETGDTPVPDTATPDSGPPPGDDTGTIPLPWLVDVGLPAGVQDRLRRNRGLAAADFDLDGDVDLYLANPYDPATLLLNNGDGTFVEQVDAPTTGVDSAAGGADFDNDGDTDLLVVCGSWSQTCANALYRNDGIDPETGSIVFTDVSDTSTLGEGEQAGFGSAWADYDLDGDLDVFINNKVNWANPDDDSTNRLYRNNGDGSFTEVSALAGVADTGDNHTATWIDIEPDGDPDLFVPALLSDNRLYINQGDGTFIEDTPDLLKEPYQAFGAATADFNNDGRFDLLVTANSLSAWLPDDRGDEPTIFLNQADGTFTSHPLPELVPTLADARMRTMGFAIGDLNMDGQIDLFFGNGEPMGGAKNHLFLGGTDASGSLMFEDVSEWIDHPAAEDDGDDPYRPYPYRTHGSTMIDVDNDFDLDLFIGNGGMNLMPEQEEPNRLFQNNPADAPAVIRVDLEGTRSNRDAVGAVLTIWSDADPDRPVVRHITRSSGFNASMPRIQVVGLGDRPGPYSMTVLWPLGTEQTVHDVAAGETVRLVEPE